jgi:ferredoxin--NADP+ reductase
MSKPVNSNLRKVTVTGKLQIAKDVYVLRFEKFKHFTAGQMLRLSVQPAGISRLYSIASGEDDHEISILFDEKPDGSLSPLLSRLEPGDTLFCSDPFGSFLCKTENGIWIANGTGIAPFVSMALSGYAQGKTLIQGARTLKQFYYKDVLETILKENYVKCCSGEQHPGLFYGRITDYLKHNDFNDKTLTFYLCGSAEMVVDTRDILIEKGFSFDKIQSEIYF